MIPGYQEQVRRAENGYRFQEITVGHDTGIDEFDNQDLAYCLER